MIPRLTRPAGVLLDMGGVLLESGDRYDAETFPAAFPNGLPDGGDVDWFVAMSEDCIRRYVVFDPPRPALDPRPVIAEWLVRKGEPATPERVEYWRYVMERWEARPVYPHVRPALEALADMGIRMGVVSNTFNGAGYLREQFERAGIMPYFEFTVFSAEYGVNKPDPRIFHHALDGMGLLPSETWYVGDKPHRDVCGAHGAGMTAVLVESRHWKHIDDAPENRPDVRIGDLSELPGILRALEA